MILQALTKQYENLAKQGKVSREGWCRAKVSYAINSVRGWNHNGHCLCETGRREGEKEGMGAGVIWRCRKWLPVPPAYRPIFCATMRNICWASMRKGTNPRVQECFEAAKEKHISLLKGVEREMARASLCVF